MFNGGNIRYAKNKHLSLDENPKKNRQNKRFRRSVKTKNLL